MTVAMALAERTHHSSQKTDDCQGRGLKTRTQLHNKNLGPPTPQPELFSLYEEQPGGVRPGSVTDPAPQVRVVRHIVEHRVEACPFVQIFDAPVPQGGNQLVEAFRHLDLHAPSRIEVPKISSSPRRSRRRWVPLVQTAEQFPAADVGAEHGHSCLTVMAVGVGEVFKVHAQDRIQQCFMEQKTLTFQFLKVVVEEEVFSVYAQIRIQLLHPRTRVVLRMRFSHGFFALFPRGKKCEVGSALAVGTECAWCPSQ